MEPDRRVWAALDRRVRYITIYQACINVVAFQMSTLAIPLQLTGSMPRFRESMTEQTCPWSHIMMIYMKYFDVCGMGKWRARSLRKDKVLHLEVHPCLMLLIMAFSLEPGALFALRRGLLDKSNSRGPRSLLVQRSSL
ncbi:hypothetical protein L873DRAFT_1247716 [Choiromyces venosus 120613-1]|uniref:Uncharacterized protein n=1 Tax=Choiromyces venosus 120613-1 TaxID=1336337 RepID=A0A3N4JHH3_9PEZI|nr:hypothetical protein L873DRAFT_1247716 [Choiromyces venosus 120613-1]